MVNHNIALQDGELVCQVCGSRWKHTPGYPFSCPGVMIYWKWGTAPEHLQTRRQIGEQGLSVGSDAPAGCVPNSQANRKRGMDWIWLYDVRNARPKRALTPAQQAARENLIEKHKQARTCKRCGAEQESRRDLYGGICKNCLHLEMLEEEHDRAAEWARQMLSNPGKWVVLDTETSGLDNPEVVQVAVVAPDGREIFVSLVRPKGEIEPGAIAVHGITLDMVSSAPPFDVIYEHLVGALDGKQIVAYNVEFDQLVLDRECRRHNLPFPVNRWVCAMEQYAAWYGEWSDYHQDFRWQKLPGGDHSAAGDCRAVLDLMRKMAQDGKGSKDEN